MSGICLAVGAADGRANVNAMLAGMARFGQQTEMLEPAPGVALGTARHARLPGDKSLQTRAGDLTVVVDGEVFDAAGDQLKVVANMAVGYDNVDVPAAT